MSTASEHCRTLLSAIIPDRRDLLDKALKHLTEDHFPDRNLKTMFILLKRYADVTGSIIGSKDFSTALKGKDSGTIALFEELYAALATKEADESDFLWSLKHIRELAAERATDEALVKGREILLKGTEDEKGNILKGQQDCRNFISAKFGEIDTQLLMQESPEGNMRNEADEILAEYADGKQKKAQGRGDGIQFGIPSLDAKIGGVHEGYLALIAGYSASGKSSLLSSTAWHACVNQGLNIAFMTIETVRPSIRTKILCRHSMLPQFGLPQGIDSNKVMSWSLSDEEERIWQDVIDDFTRNPAYGRMYIAQLPRGATVSTIESRLNMEQRNYNVDGCMVDYAQLLHSERRRNSDREEQSNVVKALKQLAVTFDDGRGLPIFSPWQVSRAARDKAAQSGYYTTSGLSETSESVNSPDLILSLLEPEDTDSRYVELHLQGLKSRYSTTFNNMRISADYATCTFTDKSDSGGHNVVDGEDLSNLL